MLIDVQLGVCVSSIRFQRKLPVMLSVAVAVSAIKELNVCKLLTTSVAVPDSAMLVGKVINPTVLSVAVPVSVTALIKV